MVIFGVLPRVESDEGTTVNNHDIDNMLHCQIVVQLCGKNAPQILEKLMFSWRWNMIYKFRKTLETIE